MTTYRFKTKTSIFGPGNSELLSYLAFTVFAFLFSVFHVLNIPAILGLDFHFFLFELGIFTLIFGLNYKPYLFTILFFYSLIDFLNSSAVGISFLSFLVSLFFIKYIFNKREDVTKQPSPIGFSASFFLFLVCLICVKLIISFFLLDEDFDFTLFLYLIKSAVITFIFCINFAFIFKN